jgi:hypothetical protein
MAPHTREDLIRVRAILIEVASRGRHITYQDLARRARLRWNHASARDRRLLGSLLGAVSHHEYSHGRPMLTAIVVRKDNKLPGKGFWGFEDFPVSREFCDSERKRVHDFWLWPTS